MKSTTTPTTRQPTSGFWLGIKDAVSIGLASGLFGVVFGALAQTKGLSLLTTAFMSAVMYAGAGQIMTLQVWDPQHPHLLTLMLVVFIVCLRYFLMGLSLRPHFDKLPKWKVYLSLFLLMDENWALTLVKAKSCAKKKFFLLSYFAATGLFSYCLWLVGTLVGAMLAKQIPNLSALGIGFAFTALFLGLLMNTWRDKRDALAWGTAFTTALVAKLLLPGNWYIIVGTLMGSFVGVIYEFTA